MRAPRCDQELDTSEPSPLSQRQLARHVDHSVSKEQLLLANEQVLEGEPLPSQYRADSQRFPRQSYPPYARLARQVPFQLLATNLHPTQGG